MTAEHRSLFPLRDRLVCAVCNWLLNHVASERYRAMIGGSILFGLRAAAGECVTTTNAPNGVTTITWTDPT